MSRLQTRIDGVDTSLHYDLVESIFMFIVLLCTMRLQILVHVAPCFVPSSHLPVSRGKEIRVADLCLFVTRLQLREIAIQPPDLWTYSNEGEFYKRAPACRNSRVRAEFPLGSSSPLKFASLL